MWRASSLEKDPDAGKTWGQEKGATEDEVVGWHHQLNGHEFEQALGDGEDNEAWCDAVHGISKSRTWLKWLNSNDKFVVDPSKDKSLAGFNSLALQISA